MGALGLVAGIRSEGKNLLIFGTDRGAADGTEVHARLARVR